MTMEEMMELENYGIDWDKNLQLKLKLAGKNLMKNRTSTVLKQPPTNYSLITKVKISTLLGKKLADTILNR